MAAFTLSELPCNHGTANRTFEHLARLTLITPIVHMLESQKVQIEPHGGSSLLAKIY
jgi:hypothetical protein